MIHVVVTVSCGQDRKYLVNTVSLHSKLPSKALGGIRLGAVLGQLALIVVTHSRLSAQKTHNFRTQKRAAREHLRRGRVKKRATQLETRPAVGSGDP